MSREEAGAAVERTLLAGMGPDAVRHLALAQVRVAWQETVAAAKLERGGLSSRVTAVSDGTARVEASEAILAQELTLRAEALVWSVNQLMQGRPGATIVLRSLAVSVARSERDRSL